MQQHGIEDLQRSDILAALRAIEASCFDVLTLRTLSRSFSFYFKGVRHANIQSQRSPCKLLSAY